MKIRPVGAKLLHAELRTDGRTDMTKLIVAFRYFPNAPKHIYSMKGKGAPAQATDACGESGYTAPITLNLGTGWGSCFSFRHRPL